MRSIRIAAILILTLLAACATTPRGSNDVQQFHITPVRPVEQLRVEALAATTPLEEGSFRPSAAVQRLSLEPTLRLDIRYSTSNKYLGTTLYSSQRLLR